MRSGPLPGFRDAWVLLGRRLFATDFLAAVVLAVVFFAAVFLGRRLRAEGFFVMEFTRSRVVTRSVRLGEMLTDPVGAIVIEIPLLALGCVLPRCRMIPKISSVISAMREAVLSSSANRGRDVRYTLSGSLRSSTSKCSNAP
jgi:hypothetical protein